jgi:peroxiredoxin
MTRIQRIGVVVVAVLVTGALAYVLGAKAAGWWDRHDRAETRESYRSDALALSRAVLKKMGTVAVGDTLTDFTFEDIDGEVHSLSDVLTDPTLIIYVKPDCDACLEEIERISQVAETPDDYRHFVLISTANPVHLQRLRSDFSLGCYILYDEERFFGNALKIESYPFGLLVDSGREIQEVYVTALPEDQLSEFLKQ